MEKLVVSSKFFNPLDTLSCGQVFRYKKRDKGYLVISQDKICYIYEDGENVVIESEDSNYFYNYFDLSKNYQSIYDKALSYNSKALVLSANLYKGIRILKQNGFEMLFSFIISQNNNIKRITLTIERLCEKCGKKISSPFGDYYAFPTASEMQVLTETDYKDLGFGYRGKYFISLLSDIKNGLDINGFNALDDSELYKKLTSLLGVGDKVANCVMLFGFFRTKTFPVDTWIEKVYLEEFNGALKDRKKISEWFIGEFGDYSGYIQQYLFHYIRTKTL